MCFYDTQIRQLVYIYIYIYGSGVSRFHSDSARHRYGAYNTHVHTNNPVTSVYSTNLFHGTAGLLLAQSSGILLILHYRFQQIATELELDDRIETIAERESFITLKDHKPNFNNSPKCRLINPAKSEIGKASKQILEKIVQKTVSATGVNLWRNTSAVLEWFNSINNKQSASFICFDIVDFYPSISENLLREAIDFAGEHQSITPLDKDIIFHSKKSLMFNSNAAWSKKEGSNNLFDITMGSYDGAEACELVVCFLLSQLNKELDRKISLGLYRDDGLAVAHGTAQEIEITMEQIRKTFDKNGLKITIEANKKAIDFLDVTLNLSTETHQPYIKPGNVPLYINTKSNHPPSIIKAVPEGINKRLSKISSNEEIFKRAIPEYQAALKRSGHSYQLTYKPDPNKSSKDKCRTRPRHITWYNPPFDMNVKNNVGRIFLGIVNSSFPESHALKPIFNRNTLKLSYSCMPNVKNAIDAHNKAQLKKPAAEPPKNCNCRDKPNCPLNGGCRAKGIVYQATVTTPRTGPNNTNNYHSETYVGLTDTEFKLRYANHKQSFSNQRLRNATELSKYIWSLREKNIEYKITWKILGKAHSYSNRTKKCNLCLLEKFHIICHQDKASLNRRSELVNHCRHADKFLLKNT